MKSSSRKPERNAGYPGSIDRNIVWPDPDVDARYAPPKLLTVPAWIPDTLRSFLAHEVENDELHLGLPPIPSVGDLALAVCEGGK